MIAAFAARLLGTKSGAGHELAVAAYEICTAYDLGSICQLVPEALLAPESNDPAAAATDRPAHPVSPTLGGSRVLGSVWTWPNPA